MDMIDSKVLGRKFKEALHRSGQSANWLAENTGIGLSTIYSIINGYQLPSLDKMRQLSKTLNLSVDWLLDIENDSFYIRPETGRESQSYAEFEEFWLGESSGERLSVSRNFSIVHQPVSLRKQVLERIYNLSDENIEISLNAFTARRKVIDQFERRRLEIVVISEIEDFILQRGPWDRLDFELIEEFTESIIARLKRDLLGLEIVLIPRQQFLVNYEILNREVILFDLGTIFLRQSHNNIVEHFIEEIQNFQRHPETIDERGHVIEFLQDLLEKARDKAKANAGEGKLIT